MAGSVDDFDRDEPTNVDRDKESQSLQVELDRVALVELSKRATLLEEQVGNLRDLVRQLIDRQEDFERKLAAVQRTTSG